MSYKVTVSVKNEIYNGVFTFLTLEGAAKKVASSVHTGMSRRGISENFLINAVAFYHVTFWCEDERLSHCKIEAI